MALKPWEFEQLQPGEFYELWEGYQWREDHENTTQSYWTSYLVSAYTGKAVKPKDLWKPRKRK